MASQYAIGAVNAVTSIFDIFVAVIVSVYILSERDEILGFFKRNLLVQFLKIEHIKILINILTIQMKYSLNL